MLAEVDVSDPARLRLVRTLTLDGSYVAARLVGASVRIVAAAQVPAQLPFVQPTDGRRRRSPPPRAENEPAVVASLAGRELAAVLPDQARRREGRARRARSSSAATCAARPRSPGLGMLTVLTVDLAKGLEPVDSAAVMTDGRIVYASPESLYVATERWADRPDPDKPTERAERRPDRDPQVRHLEPA